VVGELKGEDAFRPESEGNCPLVKKWTDGRRPAGTGRRPESPSRPAEYVAKAT